MNHAHPHPRLIILFLWTVVSLLIASCSSSKVDRAGAGRGEPAVRVLLFEQRSEVTVHAGSDLVVQLDGAQIVVSGGTCTISTDRASYLAVTVAGRERGLASDQIACFTSAGTPLTVGGKQYSDTLIISRAGNVLYVVNKVPMETYLKGVVTVEMGGGRTEKDFEALRAQAMLARTYALSKMQLPTVRMFDLFDDSRDQVYPGIKGTDPLAARAVSETRGEFLRFGGQYAEAYYHSTCGGKTEAPQLVWGRPQGKPYLNGVVDATGGEDYCRISPSYRWTEMLTRAEAEAAIRKHLGTANGEYAREQIPMDWYLLDLRIPRRMPSGRIAELKIIMGNKDRKKTYSVFGDRIRSLFRRTDGAILRSALFDLTLERDDNRWITSIRIDGGGSGHGVGMCQWGAIGMSRKGLRGEEILATYFPGTETARLY